MKYSHAQQINEIIRHLLAEKTRDTAPMKEHLLGEAKEFRAVASSYQPSETTWGASQSEWEFISVLQGLGDLLDLSDDQVKEGLRCIGDTVAQDAADMRVVFFVQEYSLWASFRTVYEYFDALDGCIVDMVYVYSQGSLPSKEKDKNIQDFKRDGYPVVDMDDYDLSLASPDIAFYLKPYKESNGTPAKFYSDEVSKHVKYTAFISYCLDVQGGSELVKYFYALPTFFHVWKMIAYSAHYAAMLRRFSYCDGKNIVEFGHPKFDGINQVMQKDAFRNPEWDQQINGRPVVMWNAHFSVQEGRGVGTFFTHRDVIFDYFRSHQDVVLLWRPHPYFWRTVEEDPRCGEGGMEALLHELDGMDNVIVDRSGDYRYAFACSDALISDAATFLVEFAITGRPVMYTPKSDGEAVINDDYLAGMAIGETPDDLCHFMDGVTAHNEEGERRRTFFENEFGLCDGRNGERIGSYIIDAMNEDCIQSASALLGCRGEE